MGYRIVEPQRNFEWNRTNNSTKEKIPWVV